MRRLVGLLALVVSACGGSGDGGEGGITVTTGGAAGAAGASSGSAGTAGSNTAGAAGVGKGGTAGASGKAGAAGGSTAGKAGASGGAGAGGTAGASAGKAGSGGAPVPCTTRVTYGHHWIHGPNHPADFDEADGVVTWDGVCTDDGPSSFAVLSNGWKPYFEGHAACLLALDPSAGCPDAACATRVSYGPAWQAPPGHPDHHDDVPGRVTSDEVCHPSGGEAYEVLSNGWTPTYAGSACQTALRYTGCGGLYENPVIPVDCPDPGVMRDGGTYVLTCTGGDAGGTYVIRTSTDLVSWKTAGHVFPSGKGPTWATGSFWAPEIHRVGSHYVAYFSAKHTSGRLAVGAATSSVATGPFTDLGQPLVLDGTMGMIDAHAFVDAQGKPNLVWKEDGNAVGKPTPIYGQPLSADGTKLTGARATLLTNDLGWEGDLVEGPFVVQHGGEYFLFYSANGYATSKYAVGVARSPSPLGPYTKHGAPILVSAGDWAGPGHGSVVPAPSGGDAFVYHAWKAGQVGGGPGRLVLLDAIVWEGGWPRIPSAPSSGSRPRF